MDKIDIINKYIDKCKKVLDNNDIYEAEELEDEIVSIYYDEIKGLTTGLDSYSAIGYTRDINYLQDISRIKIKLENYKGDLNMKINSMPSLTINNTAIATATTEVKITLEQTIKNIHNLPSNILNDDDKQELEDKLASLKLAVESKNKEKIGKKLINVLKFAITKGPETIIAISNFINFIANEVCPLFK